MSPPPPYGACAPRGFPSLLIAASRTTPLGRGQTRKLLWEALKASGGTAYDVEARGARMRLHPHDNTVERKLLLAPEQYCGAEIAFLGRALAGGGTFVDIGANIGAFTLPLAKLPEVRVVAIEPNPVAVERLAFNIAANGLSNAALLPIALSDAAGEVELTIASDDIKLSGVAAKYASGPSVTVPTRTLASVLAEHAGPAPLAIKIDVEGLEDRILLPYFAETPPERLPAAVVIEAIEREGKPKCLDLMAELGYRAALKTRANVGLLRG